MPLATCQTQLLLCIFLTIYPIQWQRRALFPIAHYLCVMSRLPIAYGSQTWSKLSRSSQVVSQALYIVGRLVGRRNW
ncbi:hypothetical protein EV424DRAFT_1390043 [Suillus variegatus]|nr:hypothetical protein EV424DRAFT_1390043 [Suillus variegatus]